jgi:hypothetical protein
VRRVAGGKAEAIVQKTDNDANVSLADNSFLDKEIFYHFSVFTTKFPEFWVQTT